MKNLNAVLKTVKEKCKGYHGKYYIPKAWNSIGYDKFTTDASRPNEIIVNPYDFFAACVEKIENAAKLPQCGGITEQYIYGAFLRSYTAWNHSDDKSKNLNCGTIFKTIMMLYKLWKNGTTILYLLPIFRCSEFYIKGELGSPYAIRDVYKLDENLHDDLLGEYSPEMIETEFKALVEACHMLGIKVIVDFAFRTVGRDSTLLLEHPEWFYWISSDTSDKFTPPKIGDGSKTYPMNMSTVKRLYNSPDLHDYLSQFTVSPNQINPDKWEEFKKNPGKDYPLNIEKEFGVTTVPGFPDVINDKQPAWTDVTYLKYYFDCAPEVAKYIPEGQAPFIMQDGASLDKFHGSEKNQELWDYVTNVLPYYKTTFGIDGARIDMAHAMPVELNSKIISTIRSLDKDFLLWSEELDAGKGAQAGKDGFQVISGYAYIDYKKIKSSGFNRKILNECYLKSEVPVVASVETPDTPRSAYIHQNNSVLKMLLILNTFMPNSVPYLNAGQEIMEIQPMNLGLDNNEDGRYVLPKDDPAYGKLAFFDITGLHWERDFTWVDSLLSDVMDIRRRNIDLLKDNRNFINLPELLVSKKMHGVMLLQRRKESGLCRCGKP
ncbi:MAG TPA: alpha amylase [Ruminiclostridium sp.]|nr:alpha amylase [Ruminiclostridium sp.]